ncbi:Asparagine synthetase [glutamine-hydrolyzing] [hydrothermal vent metagenome]|uniref:Asparagine synthetase [glutamine-hydrolyzing] n=1 Tax=hydrothermal vent metagenome TaxID=652676 RepID=A0A3B0X199_9ZZZZ
MCGIVGIFNYQTPRVVIDPVELRSIRDQMTARGPDDFGEWFSKDYRLALGHRRLSILDLTDKGKQPMQSREGSIIIVFNGEIYNYRALRKKLKHKGYVFNSQSDTEVLLYLYKEYGVNMFSHLRGMYAFVLWDNIKKGLLLARDPFGIKPLYYADDGKTIRIASQVKALLKSHSIDKTPDLAGNAGFCIWGYVPEPYSFYKNIQALPSGSYMWVDKEGRGQSKKFCDITEILAQASLKKIKFTSVEIKEYLYDVFSKSVRSHLISDVPVGVFLSAGFDSTVITALAAEAQSQKLKTVTIGFTECRGTPFDETHIAEEVSKRYGTDHHTVWISKKDFQAELPTILNVMDQPTVDGINSYFVSKAANEIGLKVVLSGLGGDELFGTYKTFRYIPFVTRLTKICNINPYFGKLMRQWIVSCFRNKISSKYAGLLEYGNSYSRAYLLGRARFMPWEISEMLGKTAASVGLKELEAHFFELTEGIQNIRSNHLKISALEITQYMRSQLLRHTDWAGMTHSLETRVPFVDIEVIKAIAPLFSLVNKPTKLDMANSIKKTLPQSVFTRPKTGFFTPLNKWLQSNDQSLSKNEGFRCWMFQVFKHFNESQQ